MNFSTFCHNEARNANAFYMDFMRAAMGLWKSANN